MKRCAEEEKNSVKVGGRTKRQYISSYKVFKKFIRQEEGVLKPDVSGVFSEECFSHWLSTRPGDSIKFPAQSFQRVLYAHIRGSDKRNPFPEAVEHALLERLRDPDNNPWEQVFKDEKKRFGKRGFKKLGFHEQRKLIERSSNSSEKPSSGAENLQIAKSSQASYPQGRRPKLLPWDQVMACLRRYVPIENLKAGLISANKRNIEIWSPTMFFYLNELADPDDFRFSPDFNFPSSSDQVFRDDRELAVLELGVDNIIIAEDHNALQLFGGSSLDKHICELHSSRVAFCYSLIGHVQRLYEKGFVWRRALMFKQDGSRMVCTTKLVNIGPKHILYVQDHSDLYLECLKKVCFF